MLLSALGGAIGICPSLQSIVSEMPHQVEVCCAARGDVSLEGMDFTNSEKNGTQTEFELP